MTNTQKEYYGQIIEGKFIVHKTPAHVLNVYRGFGCAEERLKRMRLKGVQDCLIFFHPDDKTTELYKTTIGNWLRGLIWNGWIMNKWGGKVAQETQRIIPMADCEKD